MARPRLVNRGFMAALDLPMATITPLNYCTSAKGVLDDTTREQMSEAMAAYANVTATKSLALFFHGGLVDKASGMNSARQLFARMIIIACSNSVAAASSRSSSPAPTSDIRSGQATLEQAVKDLSDQEQRDVTQMHQRFTDWLATIGYTVAVLSAAFQ